VIHPDIDTSKHYTYGFWHDKHFSPAMFFTKSFGNGKHAGLVSASRDGDILSTWLKLMGYHVVRGSSSRKAISSVVQLIDICKEGYSVGIAADGPRGPQYQAKSGVAYVAYKSGLGLIPLGAAYSSKWQFKKSWDKFQLPLPFSRVLFYHGQPLQITDINDIEQINQQVAQAINAADTNAQRLLEMKDPSLSVISTG
jgi:hypothetical protein